MGGEKTKRGDDDLENGPVDFRHLNAFQLVYQNRSYKHAGYDLSASRKSILRMVRNLEHYFDSNLFTERADGELVPEVLAERLFNDLRSMNSARHRLDDHVSAIHKSGRLLHIGCSPVVFRTREFRSLFRELQSLDGIRIRYMVLDVSETGKGLLSGHCDLFIGGRVGTESRFLHQDAGRVSFRAYRRGEAGGALGKNYVISLDEEIPRLPPINEGVEWTPLDEDVWLNWLDHPEKCPLGSVIFAPDVEMDTGYWQPVDCLDTFQFQQPLYANFLRQHPYEFLPTLMIKLKNRQSAA